MKACGYLILSLGLVWSIKVYAQGSGIPSGKQGQALIDSLTTGLLDTKEDTTKVKLLNEISWHQILTGNYDSAFYYSDLALQLARRLSFRMGEAVSYNHMGNVYVYRGDFREAYKYHLASLKVKEEIGDKRGIAASLNNIGLVYSEWGNFPEALKYYFQALRINEELGNEQWTGVNNANIGMIYNSLHHYPEALLYYFKALEITKRSGDKHTLCANLNNIGFVYIEKGDYQRALRFHYEALKISKEIGAKREIAISYGNIGLAYFKLGNYTEALKNHMACLKMSEEIGNSYAVVETYKNIGNVYIKLGKLDEAKVWLQKGLVISREIGAKETLKAIYEGLVEVSNNAGDYRQAFENHKMFMLYSDSLFNETNTRKQTQAEMQFEFDKKESLARTEQIRKEELSSRNRNILVIALVLVLIFALVFLRQRNKIAKEKQKSDELLLNILPVEVATELKQTGQALAKQFNNVTVLFTDFVGFTKLSEELEPTELVAMIHRSFTAFDMIIEKHGLEKIKTIGDAYLAVCGLPQETPDHAQRVVKAALEIQQYTDKSGDPFRIRIGIHSGPVVAGIVGVKKYAYDIWGDTVNTAARMEQHSEAGKINISGSTYELVKDEFVCESRGKIKAKNKGEVEMFFVIRSLSEG